MTNVSDSKGWVSSRCARVLTVVASATFASLIAAVHPARASVTTDVGSGWSDPHVFVVSGQPLTITAGGMVHWQGPQCQSGCDVAPVGLPPNLCPPGARVPFAEFPCYSLVAQIGAQGRPFAVGSSYRGVAPQTGQLFLVANVDYPSTYGAWSVTINTDPPATPPSRAKPSRITVMGIPVSVGGAPSAKATVVPQTGPTATAPTSYATPAPFSRAQAVSRVAVASTPSAARTNSAPAPRVPVQFRTVAGRRLPFETLASAGAGAQDVSMLEAWKRGYGYQAAGKQPEAVFWFERAALKGNVDAATELGDAYRFGLGAPRNLGYAAAWYEVGAAAGDALATHRLSSLYSFGEGVAKDQKRADELLKRAYALGASDAAFDFATSYALGQLPGISKASASAQARAWSLRGLNELRKAQTVCQRQDVRTEMARETIRINNGVYGSPVGTLLIAFAGATGQPGDLPSGLVEDHMPVAVQASHRNGAAEVECDAQFSEAPLLWLFKVDRVNVGGASRYIVTAATPAQYFAIDSIRPMLQAQGLLVPIGLRNFNQLQPTSPK